MAIYGSKLTFKAPTRAEVALTDELVGVIHSHHRKLREHLFHLCMIAYGLRKHNLVKAKSGAGGNAQGQRYRPEFRDWYQKNGLTNVYGSEGNFTLYAMAGRLLEYVRWQIGADYINHLPSSMTTLYALSEVLWEQGDATDDPRRDLFAKALLEPIRDGSTFNAFIHPGVTRKEVDDWRKRQTGKHSSNASSVGDNQAPVPTNHTITVVTIKAHEDLLKFARSSGRKVTGPKIEDVERLVNELNELLSTLNQGKDRFVAESHLESVKEAYEEAKNPNFGAAILAAEGSRKKTKKG
jgi:hypothetical protein